MAKLLDPPLQKGDLLYWTELGDIDQVVDIVTSPSNENDLYYKIDYWRLRVKNVKRGIGELTDVVTINKKSLRMGSVTVLRGELYKLIYG